MKKLKGYILRSKCQIFEEGEKSTKFFLGLEKKKAISGTIESVVVGENEVTDYKEVLDEIKKFYEQLFSKKVLNETDTHVFLEGLDLSLIHI